MKNLFIFILCVVPFLSVAQLGVFGGVTDSQIEKSIVSYSFGAEYSFTDEKGFSISPRVSLSERGGEIEGKKFKTKVLSLAYIIRQDLNIDKKTDAVLFPLVGVSFDRLKLQGKELRGSITMPLGLGVKFGKISAWFEYQLNLTGGYTASGINVGYSF